MKKKELISKLEEISGMMDCYLDDTSVATAVSEFRDIQGKVDSICNDLEDNGIEDDEPTENDSE